MIPQTYSIPTWELFPETTQAAQTSLSPGMQAVQSVDSGTVQSPPTWEEFPAAESFPVASDALALQSLSNMAND
jgi:hypothetical protein